MTHACKTLFFIDATATHLPVLGRAAASLPPAAAERIRVAACSRDDLFDDKRIAAAAETARAADGLFLLPHGGTESIPGTAVLAQASTGKLVHVQAGGMSSPEEVEMAKALGSDFGSEAYVLRQAYIRRGGVENLRNLLIAAARQIGADLPEPEAPKPVPTEGIYHPEWSGALKDRDGYLAWARARAVPGAPVIGLWFGQYAWINGDLAVIDALIAEVEAQGGVPLPVFHLRFRDMGIGNMPVAQLAETFFKQDGKTLIEALLSPMSFSLGMGGPGAEETLPGLDVPVLQLILTFNPRAEWEETLQGVSPMDVSVNAAQPEFDGAIIGTVVGTRDEAGIDPATGARLLMRNPVPDRCTHVVKWAMNWAKLRRTPPAERKVAIVFHQYPPRNDRLGCAVGLDSFESVQAILARLKAEGYRIDRTFKSGEDLAFAMIDRLTGDRRYLSGRQLAERAVGGIDDATAERWHAGRSAKMRREMDEKWGPCPGVTFHYEGKLLVGGLVNGNVFIGVQPPRARMEEADEPALQPDGRTIHDPYLPATHHYLGYYRWLREEFGAQVIFHIGKHGTLEWLPGKSLGLSQDCYPDAAIADIPHLYPYIVNDPGEGTQAKRRSYCVILDHMIPPQTNAGKTDAFTRIEDLLESAYHARQEDPGKVPLIAEKLWELAAEAHLDADLGMTREEAEADPEGFMGKLHGYIETVDFTSINDGLHVMGLVPPPARFNETMVHLTRLANGDVPSLWDAVAAARGFDGEDLRDHPGDPVAALGKTKGQVLSQILQDSRAAFDALDAGEWTDAALAAEAEARFGGSQRVLEVLTFVRDVVRPKLFGVTDEIEYAARGAAGRFVPPGGSGNPTRGRIDILPTGRNFYSVDPYKIPTREAWEVGVKQAEALIARYTADEGRPPQQVGMVLWGCPTMRNRGDDVSEILYLMGVRPVWERDSGKVKGVEPIPLAELTHARIDVTVRASGFFRDAFPNLMEMIDGAARMVAALDEPEEVNLLARNVAVDRAELLKAGVPAEEAARRAAFRVYSDKPGCYGAGVDGLLDSGQWENVDDLGDIYIGWAGYAYGEGVYGEARQDDFRKRMGRLDLTLKTEDSREYDLFSCTDFNAYHGGMNAAVKAAAGKYARSYSGDSSDPRKPRIRSTDEEGRFVFRTRVLNPKWIEGMKRHGYKGAGDLSRLVDICFHWDASSGILEDWQYAEMAKTYAFDPAMQDFFKKHNPYAMQNIAERLLEAIARGMWENPGDDKQRLEALLLEAEGAIEDSLVHGAASAAE
ncbi:cobaltochelatase subunit CobN [Oleispirillum naphthae]|uniref:cobaltochelatase subunit CobN n=1 Tax=Oleispirillum naphthae TaxID=2838853 RepID=UPI00308267D8